MEVLSELESSYLFSKDGNRFRGNVHNFIRVCAIKYASICLGASCTNDLQLSNNQLLTTPYVRTSHTPSSWQINTSLWGNQM